MTLERPDRVGDRYWGAAAPSVPVGPAPTAAG